MTGLFTNIFQFFGYMLIFGSLLFVVYVTTRYVGSKANKAMKGKYIEIIEAVNLGLDKKIYLVKAGEQYVLLASYGKSLQFLTEVKLDADSIIESNNQENGTFNFKVIFENYLKAAKEKKNKSKTQDINKFADVPDIKTSFLHKNINRLKTINNRIERLGKENEDDKPEKAQ